MTWIGKASISALRATNGGEPEPMVATTPVRATGQRYGIPIRSNSSLIRELVLNSWKASSGYLWISLLIFTIHSTVSASFASSFTSSIREQLCSCTKGFRQRSMEATSANGKTDATLKMIMITSRLITSIRWINEFE